MIGEELEGMLLVVLLAHEEQRRTRGEQDAERGEAQLVAVEPVAEGTIADLVVVLCETTRSSRSATLVGPRANRPTRAVTLVVAVALAGDERRGPRGAARRPTARRGPTARSGGDRRFPSRR